MGEDSWHRAEERGSLYDVVPGTRPEVSGGSCVRTRLREEFSKIKRNWNVSRERNASDDRDACVVPGGIFIFLDCSDNSYRSFVIGTFLSPRPITKYISVSHVHSTDKKSGSRSAHTSPSE